MNTKKYSPKTKWLMLGLTYIALLSMMLVYVGWTPALGSIMEDLSLSYSEGGLLASAIGVAGGIVLLFAGLLVDTRFGAKKVIILALATGAIGQFLLANSDSFAMAMGSRVLAGVSVGLLMGGCYPLAMKWFQDAKQYGFASGVLLTTDGVGGLLALYAFAFALTGMGWRAGLSLGGWILLGVLVLILVFVRDAPIGDGRDEPEMLTASSGSVGRWLKAALSRNVVFGTLFMIGTWGFFTVVATWMPTVLAERGWSLENAGLFAAFLPVAGAVSAVVMGVLIDKVQRKKRVLMTLGFVVVLVLGVFGFSMATGNYLLMIIMLPVIGLVNYATGPVALGIGVSSVGSRNAGAAVGLFFGASFLIGGALYPYIIASIKDQVGDFTTGFIVACILSSVLCVVAPFFVRESNETESGGLNPSTPEVAAVAT